MSQVKTSKEIEIMRKSGRILAIILNKLKNEIKAGITTESLDIKAAKMMEKYHVKSAFKGFQGYPYSTCVSINEEIVHGLPSKRIIQNGDIVSIDSGVMYRGYNSDAAFTVAVGQISNKTKKLIQTTEKVLKLAISLIKEGASLKSIQLKMQEYAHKAGFAIIRDLTGHGIGKSLQEEPVIANYPYGKKDIILKSGMTFCVEPMLSCGDWRITSHENGWAIETADKSMAAHFEHTLAVTKTGCEILTALDEKKY